uniref:Uncharacterized protein n=1 Tax=Anguilla anguilla TaxID=7936 RepID=A0A0E9TPV6_ANGAN
MTDFNSVDGIVDYAVELYQVKGLQS